MASKWEADWQRLDEGRRASVDALAGVIERGDSEAESRALVGACWAALGRIEARQQIIYDKVGEIHWHSKVASFVGAATLFVVVAMYWRLRG